MYNEFRGRNRGDSENVNDDIVFEMELIKQVEINIDYILMLIRKYHDSHLKDKEIIISIQKAIDSSLELRNKKDLIENFINSLTPSSDVNEDFVTFMRESKDRELAKIIEDENLSPQKTKEFAENAFRDGILQTSGTSFAGILPSLSRFSPNGERTQKRNSVIEKLTNFFKRFKDIV